MEPTLLHAMRLERCRDAYRKRDLVTAILEAEELLDEDPNNAGALEIVSDAEIGLGHGREAVLALTALKDIAPDSPRVMSGLAVARFLDLDFEGSLAAADAVLAQDPDAAEALAYRSLALERLGDWEGSRSAEERAAIVSPELFPLPPDHADVEWDEALDAAIAKLPTFFQAFYNNVLLVWHHLPDVSTLSSIEPPLSPMMLALYEGAPPPDGDAIEILPRSVRLFWGNARRLASNLEYLVEELAQALLVEAADWMGLRPDQLEGHLDVGDEGPGEDAS
jgi:tetratricopeptide (TPR) repeat protein